MSISHPFYKAIAPKLEALTEHEQALLPHLAKAHREGTLDSKYVARYRELVARHTQGGFSKKASPYGVYMAKQALNAQKLHALAKSNGVETGFGDWRYAARRLARGHSLENMGFMPDSQVRMVAGLHRADRVEHGGMLDAGGKFLTYNQGSGYATDYFKIPRPIQKRFKQINTRTMRDMLAGNQNAGAGQMALGEHLDFRVPHAAVRTVHTHPLLSPRTEAEFKAMSDHTRSEASQQAAAQAKGLFDAHAAGYIDKQIMHRITGGREHDAFRQHLETAGHQKAEAAMQSIAVAKRFPARPSDMGGDLDSWALRNQLVAGHAKLRHNIVSAPPAAIHESVTRWRPASANDKGVAGNFRTLYRTLPN